ncbi:sulfite exporter TauE/SafE family protein [Halobacillus locisalis]|uniref:Sulfite exporter TauE/SafE family protein n=1 Tax=Halobacillus locisalis TaxID=220753 RepID=A0A838CU42_9BACI|nr:sulfite exporter TauE/SafE family protein [Halobacillus locisalis]MBA2175662.1 sulfite exporter TauE/SafE family protein [Halobacillus locisalis]
MYQIFSEISAFLSGPFHSLALKWEGIPILSAFLLGLVGAFAPCQFTGNIGAITIYGNRSLQSKVPWLHVTLFIMGKVFVFSILGLVVWVMGKEIQSNLTAFIPFIRKMIGPVLVVMGLFLMGIFQMKWNFNLGKIPDRYLKDNPVGSFLVGVSFTLAFCPTMFILFFMTLMPVVLSTSYGAVLPTIFAIGTSVPLIFSIFLIWYFELSGSFMKKGRKLGGMVQKIAGILLIVVGVLDTLTYW